MKKHLILSVFALLSYMLNAQVSGLVVDGSHGITLPGATVLVDPGNIGTSSGPDGHFEINGLDEGRYELRVSFVGYETVIRHINVSSSRTVRLTIELSPSVIHADDIVVTGTKTERKLEEVPVRLELVGPRVFNYKGEHYADDMNTVLIDPFSSIDVRLWKTVGHFNFKLDIENILDKVALVDEGFINYGRFLRMEINYLF